MEPVAITGNHMHPSGTQHIMLLGVVLGSWRWRKKIAGSNYLEGFCFFFTIWYILILDLKTHEGPPSLCNSQMSKYASSHVVLEHVGMLQAALGEWRQRFTQNVCGASIADSVPLLVRRGTIAIDFVMRSWKVMKSFTFATLSWLCDFWKVGPASDGLERLQGSRLYRSLDWNLTENASS